MNQLCKQLLQLSIKQYNYKKIGLNKHLFNFQSLQKMKKILLFIIKIRKPIKIINNNWMI
jgi:hypothetical protein